MALRLLKNPVFIGLFFILCIALIYLSARLLPFVDLPNHLAEATIFKELLQGDQLFQSYYQTVPWYYPNTFHVYFTTLFPSIEWGDRFFFLIYLFMLPLTVFLIIRKLDGNLWGGLLIFLFVFNYNVTFGFVGYFIAIPFVLLFFYILIPRKGSADSIGVAGVIQACILLLIIYFMHAQAALFAMMLLGFIHLIQYWKRPRQFWRTVAILVPVLVLFATWWSHRGDAGEESTLRYMLHYYLTDYFTEFGKRSALFVLDFYHLFSRPWGYVAGGAFSLTVILPSFICWPEVRVRLKALTTGGGKYPLAFLLAAFLCFFLLPSKLPGQTPLFERFSTLLFIAFIIVQSVLIPGRKILKFGIVAVVAVYTLCWAQYFYEFNRTNEGFNQRFLSEPERTDLLYGLIYDHTFRDRPVYIHFPNYHTVWNHGPAASKIIDYRFGIVRRKEGGKDIPRYNEWIGRIYENVQTKPATYILMHGSPQLPDPNLADFREVRNSGTWTLLHRSR